MSLKSLKESSWFVKTVFVVSLFVILFASAVTYKYIISLSKSTDWVVHTYEVNLKLEQLLSHLKDAESRQRAYMVTNNAAYLKKFNVSVNDINNDFSELKELTSDNPIQQQNLEELNTLINERLKSLKNIKNVSESTQYNLIFHRGQHQIDNIKNKINLMIDVEDELLKKRQDEYEYNLKVTPIIVFGLIALMLLLMFLAYARINTNLDTLKEINESLSTFEESTKQSEIINKHGSWTWNVDENTFSFSDNFYRLIGEKPQSFEPTVENFMEFVHPEDVEKVTARTEQMMKEEDLPFLYYRTLHKNGNIKYLKAYGKCVTSPEGTKQLLGTTTDITDEIDNVRKLEQRNNELEINNKELAAFNYVASHDLQEPLRKIQLFISRLIEKEEGNLSESGLTYIDRIKNASTRMRLLIDDLLQYSRTNKSEKVHEITNVNLLLEAAKQDLTEKIDSENATIESETLPVMEVVPFQIQQLFINLIGNSIKYRSKDRNPVITISYQKINAEEESRLKNPQNEFYHKITFKDNGIGFEQEYADKIFTLFNRLHNKSEYSGTGIGLSICKKIMENHKGYIFGKGFPNKGAIFEVYIPVS